MHPTIPGGEPSISTVIDCKTHYDFGNDGRLDLSAMVNLTRLPSGGYTSSFVGTLAAAGLDFTVAFDKTPTGKSLLALYKNPGGGPLPLADLRN